MAEELVRSPLCLFQAPCPRAGRAALGPPEVGEGYVNRTIRCVTCGAVGVENRDTAPRPARRWLKIDRLGTEAPC